VLGADVVDVLAEVPAVDEDLDAVGAGPVVGEGQAERGVDAAGDVQPEGRAVPGDALAGLRVGQGDGLPAVFVVPGEVPALAFAVEAAGVERAAHRVGGGGALEAPAERGGG
jgi:hypothetical protein